MWDAGPERDLSVDGADTFIQRLAYPGWHPFNGLAPSCLNQQGFRLSLSTVPASDKVTAILLC
jgi:hypothetical protein